MVFIYDQVLEIKRAVSAVAGMYLHFHEGCGSQYFSFDTVPDEKTRKAAEKFISENYGGRVVFTPDGMNFTVE